MSSCLDLINNSNLTAVVRCPMCKMVIGGVGGFKVDRAREVENSCANCGAHFRVRLHVVVADFTITQIPVLVAKMKYDELDPKYSSWAKKLNFCGVWAKLWDRTTRSLSKQFEVVDRQGFSLVVFGGHSEVSQGLVAIKNLVTREQILCKDEDLVTKVRELLESNKALKTA